MSHNALNTKSKNTKSKNTKSKSSHTQLNDNADIKNNANNKSESNIKHPNAKLQTIAETKPRTQQDIRADNEQAILSAAETAFVRQGFKGATMQSIADLSGLPKANIHYYFKNKKNLYIAVLTKIISEWNDGLEDLTEDSDPKESLERFIRSKLDNAFKYPNRHKLFALEMINGAPYLHEFMSTHMTQWAKQKAAVIQSWHKQGKIAIDDPMQLLILIWTTTQRYAEFETEILKLFGKEAYDEQDKQRAADFLVPFILRGCGL